MRPLLRILRLWRGRWPWLLAGALVSLASLAAGVGLAAASGTVVAASLLGGALAASLLLRLLGPARVVLRYAERLVTHDAMFRALADLRVWFFRGLAQRSAGGLGMLRSGDMLGRLVADVETLDGIYLRILLPTLGAVLLLPVLLVALRPFGAGVAVPVALLFACGAFALPWWAAGRALAGGRLVAEAAAGLRVAALDCLSGLREVRAFGLEGRMLADVQSREAALLVAQQAQARGVARATAASLLCGQAALAVLLLRLGDPAARLGVAAIAGVFLAVAAFEAIAGLPRAGFLAGQAAAAAARVLAAAETGRPLPEAAGVAPLFPMPSAPRGIGLACEGVRFRWRDDRPLVFDGLTLDIPAGARVALLGPSGSGKSTLAALALRVAEPQLGRVLLGGVDVATLPLPHLRARVAMLSQATHLFHDTIRANLALADPEADDAALWAALDAARIGDTVRAIPGGLDAWVGEAGSGFSGGQGRRLALARALLSPARLLILDEPCAGLDAETERAFLSTLFALGSEGEAGAGRTIVLIAHRLTGVERLDRVWRLSGGHAVAAAA